MPNIFIYIIHTQHVTCSTFFIIWSNFLSINYCANLSRIISEDMLHREAIAYACFHAVKRPIYRRIFVNATRRVTLVCERPTRGGDTKNLRMTFRGNVSRLDSCRVETCYQQSRSEIRILLSCRKNVRKLYESHRVFSRIYWARN